jgi:hypothetical protein
MKRLLIALVIVAALLSAFILKHRARQAGDIRQKRVSEASMQFCHVKADRAVNTGAFENDSSAANSMWERAYNECMTEQQK